MPNQLKSSLIISALSALYLHCSAQHINIYHKGWIDFKKNGKKDIYEDPKQKIASRVEDLLAQMTVQEKANQTVTLYGYGRVLKDEQPTAAWDKEIWKHGLANIDEMLNSLAYNKSAKSSFSYPFSRHAQALNNVQKWFVENTRLGIPVDFTNEGIHGLNHDRATSLPAPINIGSTWNTSLVRKAGDIIGREAKYLGYTNVYTPILDVSRDPRWGRVVETYGEDPFHIAEMGKQVVLGIQQNGVASTLKHYAVYSVPKGGRDGNARTDPHVGFREMHSLHLYPFKRVIKEAKPLGVMSSYNDYDGVPVSASSYFLQDLLRKDYGFEGYVVSDSEALEFIYNKHHVAANYKDAIKQALEAGLNVRTNFDPPSTYLTPLMELIEEGGLDIKILDQRVREVLTVKFKLGLFDHPLREDTAIADKKVHTPADEEVSLQINRESIVLLKNEQNLLPIDVNKYKRILVTGPMAEATNYTTSRYGPSNNPITTIKDGIINYAKTKALRVDYAKGVDVVDKNWPESEIIPTDLSSEELEKMADGVRLGKESDLIIAVMGESEREVGESRSRSDLNLPGKQRDYLMKLKETGKPIVLVLVNGRPLTVNWENKYLPAIVESWFLSNQSGNVLAEMLFGAYSPSGKLPISFPKSVGQVEMNFPTKPAAQAGQPGVGPNGWGNSRVVGFLYPFGYGLSYTDFSFSNLQLTKKQIRPTDSLTVTVDVENIGKRKGAEVVQLYIKDLLSSVTTYEMDLRGFEKVELNPGEKKTLQFMVLPAHLELLDRNNNWTVEPGKFELFIGNSSVNLPLKDSFEVVN
ncbi:glycoside hydrolase family 3 N-terminal domain-containing protein [Sphingobacterium sp. UGAL515B_05]|uniref:glycoside hydrolase family 3 N-terminal domain-containing protein n=1 Tax=Sphingobacterium sp. UGAL515B_05 TaxID=2986767 RepID=UPI002954A0DD|nr:glycoside hydrolase family 3 N-terminal domain-containing protein [Sphingobacterium sp. UGAL515B_05]WON97049.1 glycoside hydrolase family 3 C-terminal domain-containing protein [Sphingobacterium sp. UGAL515B_05]